MVEEDMVSGEGWISDDSSFYGKPGLHDKCLNRYPPKADCLDACSPPGPYETH